MTTTAWRPVSAVIGTLGQGDITFLLPRSVNQSLGASELRESYPCCGAEALLAVTISTALSLYFLLNDCGTST
ncbi:hypothetical protein HBH56_160030 [Parastagonospora nodorum]|nr:hypothetical protein HBH56_160030 [Parastagonospora nodorum]KAH3922408.1 hypothetical protein HBH54_224460 [Parastagonospora nodorum]KAH4018142.1 hypothetical protein HBI13_139690 [Parastagonospora nodorum]KAH4050566.1 hypothetical protein HBH49_134100 [Parastagonospora nodorum]KAH4064753.1 hypothetical protein HBH50_175050 [Parastagonospora nodorum]